MKIFITRKLPFWDEVGKPLTEAGHEVKFGKLEELDGNYEGLLCLLTDKITDAVLTGAPKLKIIANYAVGFDNIDVPACKAKNILVTNTPSEAVNESVAEMAWTLMLALSRRLIEANDFVRNAAYRGWEPDIFLGEDLKGKTLGVIGTGRIGSLVSKRAEGFGMKVLGFSKSSGLKLADVLGQSDYVTLHLPLNPETTHIINKNNLPLFKKTAFLVNTARGPIVDEAEVVEALRAGFIAGYGADVFENEPDPHPELLQMENVILTPHIASATRAARIDMGKIAVANLLAGLSGQTPANVVQ